MEPNGIRVYGTKSAAAERVVPRVGIVVKPSTKAFYTALRAASGKTVTPYDLRRTYSQWLDLARVPQFRQSYYMGHGPKDLDQLYQRMRACSQYLREDAGALEQLTGAAVAVRLVR